MGLGVHVERTWEVVRSSTNSKSWARSDFSQLPSTAPGVKGTRAGVTNRFPSAEAHVARKRGYQVRGK